jgi:hypothetical protein
MVDARVTRGIAVAFFFRSGPLQTYPQSCPQVARMAVEILKKEKTANCGHDLFRPLDPVGEVVRLPFAPGTERE